MWYWYISGMISAFLLVSALINIGFMFGFISYTKSKSKSSRLTGADKALYDWAQDITGETQRNKS